MGAGFHVDWLVRVDINGVDVVLDWSKLGFHDGEEDRLDNEEDGVGKEHDGSGNDDRQKRMCLRAFPRLVVLWLQYYLFTVILIMMLVWFVAGWMLSSAVLKYYIQNYDNRRGDK